MIKDNLNCKNHIDTKFLFYCFDDKSFLCEECFREHKSHKVEIRADIKKVSDFIQILKKSNSKNIKSIYENIEKTLKNLKDEIENLLLEVQKLSEKFKNNEEIKTPEEIFDIKYEEFENLLNCINIKTKVNNTSLKGISFLNKIYNNFKEIIIPTIFKFIKLLYLYNSVKISFNIS